MPAYEWLHLNGTLSDPAEGESFYFLPMVGVYLVDSVFSAATDTVALP